mgnify:CR=1 FL=1
MKDEESYRSIDLDIENSLTKQSFYIFPEKEFNFAFSICSCDIPTNDILLITYILLFDFLRTLYIVP